MAQDQGTECQECQKLKESYLHYKFIPFHKTDLFESPSNVGKIKKKKLKKERADTFLMYVNAFMNEGGGILCLHVEDAHLLGAFEQIVNPSMADMIPDNSTFPENFERHVVGTNHVVFRVKPRSALLSTLSFNTKISLDCGVENPNHGQMRNLLKPKADKEELYKVHSFTFRANDEVGVQIRKLNDGDGGDPEESVFQERKNIQAKRVPNIKESFESSLEAAFFDKSKRGTYLPKYISAFCKLPQGGSIFLGLREGEESNPMRGASEESHKTEMETGVFKCEGIMLTQDEATIRTELRRLIRTKMTWITYQSTEDQPVTELPDLVDVCFHEVQPDQTRVVLEIQVKRYEGMAFYSKDGPVAYRLASCTEDGNITPEEMTTAEWLHNLSHE